MCEDNQNNINLPLFVAISITSLLIVTLLGFYAPTAADTFYWRKPLVGTVFTLVCMLGMLAALKPDKCLLSKPKSKPKNERERREATTYVLKGHHFNCGKFDAHTIHLDGHVLCAACSGLFTGAVIALVASSLYFWDLVIFRVDGLLAVLLGVPLVFAGFAQFMFKKAVRAVMNVFFVFGAFLILFGIDNLSRNLFLDLLVICMIIFWIITRILLSEWSHKQICRRCDFQCKIGIKKKG
ncbi:MAG: hypothetical protein QXJ02_04385 [Candidatus Bathyarchaeia archaeon]